MSTNRLLFLDGFRAISVILVLFFHYAYNYPMKYGNPNEAISLFMNGGIGVSLFFIISGYVILMSLEKKDLIGFVISRLSRLYPAYIFAVTLTSISIICIGTWYAEIDIINYLKNLTMFQYYMGGTNIDGVYWSLRVEMAFYIGIAFVFYAIPLRYFWLCVTSFSVSACLFNLLSSMWYLPVALDLIRKLLIFEFFPYFALGMLIYYTSDSSKKRYGENNIHILNCLLLIAIIFDLVCTKDFYRGVFLISMSLFIYLFSQKVFVRFVKVFETKLLVYIGRISYSIYLLHQVIGYLLINVLLDLGMSFIASILVTTTIIIIQSHLLFKFVEGNLSSKFNKWLLSYANK